MRRFLLTFTLLAAGANKPMPSDRSELLAADRELAQITANGGMMRGFLPSLTDSAAYLYPGAPLLRGKSTIRSFLERTDTITGFTWSAAFGDVSADRLLGYTYGATWSSGGRGKYLACWRKSSDGMWRVSSFAQSAPVSTPDSTSPPVIRDASAAASVRGSADSRELMSADSAFAALSVSRGAREAFLGFAAGDAVLFGGGASFTRGREAIGAEFASFPADAVLDWKPLAADIAGSGDLGCTVGDASIASRHRYSKYLTVWKRQADGSWKFVADGGNARPAPSGTPPPED